MHLEMAQGISVRLALVAEHIIHTLDGLPICLLTQTHSAPTRPPRSAIHLGLSFFELMWSCQPLIRVQCLVRSFVVLLCDHFMCG